MLFLTAPATALFLSAIKRLTIAALGASLLGTLACGQTGPLRLPDQPDNATETGQPKSTTPHQQDHNQDHNNSADQ